MRSAGVVVDLPCFDDPSRVGQAAEQNDGLVARQASPARSTGCRCRYVRSAAALDEPIELTGHTNAGERVVDDESQALPAEVVDHGAGCGTCGRRRAHPIRSRGDQRWFGSLRDRHRRSVCRAHACGRRASAPSAAPRDRAGRASSNSARRLLAAATSAGADSRTAGAPPLAHVASVAIGSSSGRLGCIAVRLRRKSRPTCRLDAASSSLSVIAQLTVSLLDLGVRSFFRASLSASLRRAAIPPAASSACGSRPPSAFNRRASETSRPPYLRPPLVKRRIADPVLAAQIPRR